MKTFDCFVHVTPRWTPKKILLNHIDSDFAGVEVYVRFQSTVQFTRKDTLLIREKSMLHVRNENKTNFIIMSIVN